MLSLPQTPQRVRSCEAGECRPRCCARHAASSRTRPAARPPAATPSQTPFSTEPGAYSASFEKRDAKPAQAPGAGGASTALLTPEEAPVVELLSEARAAPHARADKAVFLSLQPPPYHSSPQCGADYTLLRDLLASGQWEKADDETRLKLCQLAGEDAEAREWVYFTVRRAAAAAALRRTHPLFTALLCVLQEVKTIPATDLRTVDALWTGYSRGRFGFSVQRALWLAEKRRLKGFFSRIGWTMGDNGAYRKFPSEFLWAADAPKGHLPLTNCLRGPQLLQAVLEHPAFGGPLEPMGVRAGALQAGGRALNRGKPPLLELPLPQRVAVVAGLLALVALGLANQR